MYKKGPLFFQFNQFLGSRAEIHQIVALFFWKIEDTPDQMTSIIDFLLDLSVGQEIKFKDIHTKYQHAYT